jgi:hypothetical protein
MLEILIYYMFICFVSILGFKLFLFISFEALENNVMLVQMFLK